MSSEFLTNPVFRLYAICAVILVFKMYYVGSATARTRGRLKVTLNPEDVRPGVTLVQTEHPDVERAIRAHRNDLENIPAFLFLGLIFILAGGPALGAYICFGLFTVARVVHTITYLKHSPVRGLAFGFGVLANLALMVMILIRVL